MKNLSLVTIIAAFVSIGTVAIAPAKATDLTKVDYKGQFNIQTQLPFIENFSKDVSASITIDNFSGRLSDAGDAELTIEQPFAFLSPEFKKLLDDKKIEINYWNGSGSISNTQGFLSNFKFNYDKRDDILTINKYDFAKIQGCLNSTCNLKGNGTFGGILNNLLPMFGNKLLPVSGSLNFDVDQTAARIPDTQGLPASQSVPEPSLLLGFIGLGGLFVAKRKQQKAI